MTPNVINYAQNYFNCSSILKVPLESMNSSATFGQHWDKKVFGVIYIFKINLG
jgi:hypothetical protein